MTADFSRITFDPKKNYSNVLMQQGRVILDSDWNEMQAIISHHNSRLVDDLIGEAAYPSTNPAFTPTIKGGLAFDGHHNCLYVEQHRINFSETHPFTISVHLKWEQTTHDAVIISQWQTLEEIALASGFCFGIDKSGHPYLERTTLVMNTVEIERLTAKQPLKSGTEYHLSMVHTPNFIRIYQDHVLVAEAAEPKLPYLKYGTISIGTKLDGKTPRQCFKGILYDIAIYSRALQIHKLYGTPFKHQHHDEDGLMAWWPFTATKGDLAADISGHDNHAILGTGNTATMPKWNHPLVNFSNGQLYLDSIPVEQPEPIILPLDYEHDGMFFAYVSMRQKLISSLDESDLLEPALQGIDTTLRTQTHVSVNFFPEYGSFNTIDDLEKAWLQFKKQQSHTGQLKACSIPNSPPLNNTLYRVQIAKTTNLTDDNTLPILWCSDNSSLQYKITHIADNVISLKGMRQKNTPLTIGSCFTLTDSNHHVIYKNKKQLFTVTDIDYAEGTISFDGEIHNDITPLKLWHWQSDVIDVSSNHSGDYTIIIDERLSIHFKPHTIYQKDDYWLIPSREATNTIGTLENSWLTPFEAPTKYQPIALFKADHGAISLVEDKRTRFAPATQMNEFVQKNGSVMSGPLVLNDHVTFNGSVSKHFIGTEQIIDHTITLHKLQQNLGLQLGQCLLSQSKIPLPGYQNIGKLLGDTKHASWYMLEDSILPFKEPYVAINADDKAFILFGNGTFYEIDHSNKEKISFHEKQSFPGSAIRQFAACSSNSKLYIAGGQDIEGTKVKECFCYHINENSWERIADLPHPTSHLSLCAENGIIFAMGGLHDALFGLLEHNPTHDMMIYEPQYNQWKRCHHLPEARYSAGCVAVNGSIHYIGGSDRALAGLLSESFRDSHFVYNIRHDRWEERQPIPLKRSRFGMIEVDGIIYCIGGRTGKGYTANVQRYTIETDHWEAEASLNIPRSHVSTLILDGFIHAIGGKTIDGYTDIIESMENAAEFYVHRLERYIA